MVPVYDCVQTIEQPDGLLAANPLFGDWKPRELAALERISEVRTIHPGQAVFHQGQRCEHLHVLDHGLVKITRTGAGEAEHVCEFVKSPAILCEQNVFLQNHCPVGAEALSDARLIQAPLDELHELVIRQPESMWKLAKIVARKIDTLLQRQQQQSTCNAEQRAAALLLDIFDGRHPWRVSRRAVKQVDMANMLSISPETFCRVLAGFRRRGWIGAQHGAITILDRRGLSGIVATTKDR